MSKDRARVRSKNGRGFTLVELLAVLVILGLTLTIAGVQVMRTLKRSFLSSTVQGIQLLASRAQLEAQRRSATTFLRIGQVGSDPVTGFTPVELWADANGNGTFEAGSDLLIQQILLDPARISLSTADASKIQTLNWSNDDDTHERLLACDTFGRTMNPATGLQLAATATLSITHTDMVADKLQPRLNEQLRIPPAWSVEIVEARY
ncbi:MAG: Tfp pilus assembly protein FimT/FimU [Acidithiobacillales bacterium]